MIQAQAYGGNDLKLKKYGYVKLNGLAVWQSSWRGKYPVHRGVNVFVVHPYSCTLRNWTNFDTSDDIYAASRLRDHLLGLTDGTVLVVASADEPTRYLKDALSTLGKLGADVSDVDHRGAFVFVAEKGDPWSTVFDKKRFEVQATWREPRVKASFKGAYNAISAHLDKFIMRVAYCQQCYFVFACSSYIG